MGCDAVVVLVGGNGETFSSALAIDTTCGVSPECTILASPSEISAKKGFIIVPEEVWEALEAWYGADFAIPLSRKSFDSTTDWAASALAVDMFRPWQILQTDDGKQSTARSAEKTSFASDDSRFCGVCLDRGALRCSRCKVVYYCCDKCQACDWPYHKVRCKKISSSSPSTSPSKSDSKSYLAQLGMRTRASVHAALSRATNRSTCRGMRGLANLGNSCYFNASLQCLSHTFPLTKYLISNQYESHVNTKSRDGTRGALVKEYATLLRELWMRSFPCDEIRPIALRRLIGRENEDYATLQQQDAHDVLVFLLDRLHEDVNKVLKKPYVENSEGNGDNDEDISKEAMEKHRLRDDSVVQDIVGTQLRSQVGIGDANQLSHCCTIYSFHVFIPL